MQELVTHGHVILGCGPGPTQMLIDMGISWACAHILSACPTGSPWRPGQPPATCRKSESWRALIVSRPSVKCLIILCMTFSLSHEPPAKPPEPQRKRPPLVSSERFLRRLKGHHLRPPQSTFFTPPHISRNLFTCSLLHRNSCGIISSSGNSRLQPWRHAMSGLGGIRHTSFSLALPG